MNNVRLILGIYVALLVQSYFGVIVLLAADGPNQATHNDMNMGRWLDSLVETKNSSTSSVNSRSTLPTNSGNQFRLVHGVLYRNPEIQSGLPPYMIVDQYGAVLRYVEPVEGINLDNYLGRDIAVKRDIGQTLLATQLALPRDLASSRRVQLVQHAEELPAGEFNHNSSPLSADLEPINLDNGLYFESEPMIGGYGPSLNGCGSGVTGYGRGCHRQRYHRWYFDTDLMFLQLGDTGDFVSSVFDYEFSPRFQFGVENPKGLGIRSQFWFWDHDNQVDGDLYSVDTLNIDIEVYRRINLTNDFAFELSGGLRYHEVEDQEFSLPGDRLSFSGLGGTFGVKGTQNLPYHFQAYARAKWAVFVDDTEISGTVLADTGRSHQEIGLGIERNLYFCPVQSTLRFGYEWQEWKSNTKFFFPYQADVFFHGFLAGIDFSY